MRLYSVHVTEFKSVKDFETFIIGDMTCLVGRNESGKTALLQALYRLNLSSKSTDVSM
jgi:predicted ATP-dependent endonuclease of OLD family